MGMEMEMEIERTHIESLRILGEAHVVGSWRVEVGIRWSVSTFIYENDGRRGGSKRPLKWVCSSSLFPCANVR